MGDIEKGEFYKSMEIDPIQYIVANCSDREVDAAMRLQVLKYISRYKHPNRTLDLYKAIRCLERWIEYYEEVQEK